MPRTRLWLVLYVKCMDSSPTRPRLVSIDSPETQPRVTLSLVRGALGLRRGRVYDESEYQSPINRVRPRRGRQAEPRSGHDLGSAMPRLGHGPNMTSARLCLASVILGLDLTSARLCLASARSVLDMTSARLRLASAISNTYLLVIWDSANGGRV